MKRQTGNNYPAAVFSKGWGGGAYPGPDDLLTSLKNKTCRFSANLAMIKWEDGRRNKTSPGKIRWFLNILSRTASALLTGKNLRGGERAVEIVKLSCRAFIEGRLDFLGRER